VGVSNGDAVMAQAIEGPAPRGHRQPRARAVGHAATVPLDRRGDERVLEDVLGEREVAVQAPRDERQHRPALVAVSPLERVGRVGHAAPSPGAPSPSSPTMGWISMEP
jgi:hypothetical protein